MNIRAQIIDDEIASTDLLETLLTEFNEISEVSSYNNPIQGIEALKENQPDILFLDIEMPGITGLEILKLIETFNIHVHVILITGYAGKIIEAAKYSMIDYILKPLSFDDISVSIKKYKIHQEQHNNKHEINSFLQMLNLKIRIPSSFEDLFFAPNDIIYLEADGNYTNIITIDNKIITSSYNLGKIQKSLPAEYFCRVSRKVIINVSYLNRINRRKKVCVLSINDTIIPYSKSVLAASGL